MLQAEDNFCKLEYKKEDLSDLVIRVDRSKVLTSGRKGMYSQHFPFRLLTGMLTLSSHRQLPPEAPHLQVNCRR